MLYFHTAIKLLHNRHTIQHKRQWRLTLQPCLSARNNEKQVFFPSHVHFVCFFNISRVTRDILSLSLSLPSSSPRLNYSSLSRSPSSQLNYSSPLPTPTSHVSEYALRRYSDHHLIFPPTQIASNLTHCHENRPPTKEPSASHQHERDVWFSSLFFLTTKTLHESRRLLTWISVTLILS